MLHSSTHTRTQLEQADAVTIPRTHLGVLDGDDAVGVARAVVVVGHADSRRARRQPFLLGARVDLKDVRLHGEDGLLPANTGQHTQLFVWAYSVWRPSVRVTRTH